MTMAISTNCSPFGTICHEYTHCFGMPDFYSGSVKGLVGNWDLMGSGNYNGKGYVPAGFSAHERWLMGWITPIELTEPAAINDIRSGINHIFSSK